MMDSDNREQRPDLSFVVPCHNEKANVAPLTEAVATAFADVCSVELVFVDDGSSDGTTGALKAMFERLGDAAACKDDLAAASAMFLSGRLTLNATSFSRNFGKESAMYAGLKASRGEAVCFIDADLQQDPLVALEMYRILMANDELDVVAAYQDRRNEGRLAGWLKRRFYGIFNATSDEIELPPDMSDFRVFRRCVADALLSMPEYHRFTKGLFAWVGFNTYAMPYTVSERASGESSWSTRALFKYARTGVMSFSTWPLKLLRIVGGIIAVLAALYLLYVLIFDYLIFGNTVPGYPTLVCLILLFGGLQLLAVGVLGDYLARSYIEGKRRPIYLARERFEATPPQRTAADADDDRQEDADAAR